MRISDWSSDVCSSDLRIPAAGLPAAGVSPSRSGEQHVEVDQGGVGAAVTVGDGVLDMILAGEAGLGPVDRGAGVGIPFDGPALGGVAGDRLDGQAAVGALRSEEHTSELQSLMRISYAVFCLKK